MEAAAPQTLRITLLGNEHNVSVEELASEQSPYTGRQLRRVSISFDVAADKSEDVNRELLAASNPDGAIAGDKADWRVLNSSYSYEEGASKHRHRAELQEVEEPPTAERVEMLGLALQPRKYKEAADEDDGTLLISVLVLVEGDDDAALEAAIRSRRPERAYFPVVRVGVSDAPLQVRFGRCLWKKEESGRLHLLRLVADEGVEQGDSVFVRVHQPELGLAQKKAAALEDKLAALVSTLSKTGVLSDDQVEEIQSSVDGSWGQHFRDFDEAASIESHFG